MASVKGFLETSFLDWPGRMAAVVFLGGCNFRCPYCHNGELALGAGDLPDISTARVLSRLEELSGWVDAVVVSGGEPTLHGDLPALLETFREAGLDVKLDTNGSRPAVIGELIRRGLVQQVDMDLKAPLEKDKYALLAGVPVDIGAIAGSVSTIIGAGVPHRFRTTYVPGLLGREDLEAISAMIPRSSTYVLQAFRPGRTLDPRLQSSLPPGGPEMELLREVAARRAAA